MSPKNHDKMDKRDKRGSIIPLYMGKSMDDLSRLVSAEVYHITDKDQLKKCIKKNEKDTHEMAEKGLKKGDEERAYVFFRLYLDQLDDLWDSPVAKSLPRDDLLKLRGLTSPIKKEQAEMYCSRLKGSLEKRYTDLALAEGRGLEDKKLTADLIGTSKLMSHLDLGSSTMPTDSERAIEYLSERIRQLRADAQEEVERFLDKREKLLAIQMAQLKEEAHQEICQYLDKREFALLNEIGLLRESLTTTTSNGNQGGGPTAPGWVDDSS